jgi:hypothetical protein|tara:strand:- start:51 stop:1931 length:1881 start_codon:yes stop_codon:yes gene_type:complete
VSVSPADFELYSRATGAPLPRTAQEQMQMAPQVHQFIQSRGYQRPKGFLGEVGGYLKNAALLGGGLALANYLSSNNDDSDDGIRVDLASPGSVDASVVPQRMITGATDVIGTQPSPAPTPTPQTPVVRENVGTLGSITRPLGVQVSDPWGMDKGTTEVVTPSRGFGPAPAPRAEAEGLRDIEFSMKPPIERDPSFFNPTGNWGVGDTANLANSAINFAGQYGPTIAEQGALDIGKGVRDIQKGIDDTSVVINSVYNAGAATRQLLDSTIASLPTSSSQQSAPLETGNESILFDHPDVIQSGTGSDEVQNNRNYIAHGNVDQEGNLIKDLFEYTPENKGGVDRFGNPMPQGRVFGGKGNYFSPEGIYGGDPEMIGSASNQRVKDKFISSAGIPQINEDLVGGDVVESSAPEEEAFHALKQFVRGLTGQDSPVEYEPDSELLDNIAAEVAEVQASNGVIPNPPNFEQSQYFEPKAPKRVEYISKKTGKPTGNMMDAGGGTGVESIGYRPDGYLEVDWHGKNKEKRTEGGYVFDDYVGELKKDNRDALVRDTADPRFIQGKMSPAEEAEYLNLSHREMNADDVVYNALKDKKFGYGEGQVSPGKFAQRAKTGQGALLDYIDQNSDILRG